MGKKPVFLIFSLIFFGFLALQYQVDVRSANLKSFEILMKKRDRSMILVSTIARSLIETGSREKIEGHLHDAIRIGWIDFYVLTYDGDEIAMDSDRPLSSKAHEALLEIHPPDAFWEFRSSFESVRSIRGPASADLPSIEDFRYYEMDLGNNRRLKVGYNLDREAYLVEMAAERSEENSRIFVMTLIIALGGFLFAARDLLRVAKIVRTKGVRGLRDVKILSSEAAALRDGLEGFGEAVGRLEKENKSLTAQVLPSLRTELHSGRKPPYDFTCTMVRTDINNFTQIFHTYPVDQFLTVINEFFTSCSHIISRYDGLIHEFVGDEIIYYFKEEQHENTFTVALACAREIENVAEKIHRRTIAGNGYAFRVKSSLSYGKIRFGPLLNGFSLAGAPLIETSRVLSAVSEKNENTIHFDGQNRNRLSSVVRVDVAFEANLKGMEGQRTILRYAGHSPLEDVLLNRNSISASVLQEFRSDEDLVSMLNFIVRSPTSEFAAEAVRLLGRLTVTRCEPSLVTAIVRSLRALMASNATGEEASASEKSLASLAGALARLIPAELIDETVQSLVMDLVEHRDLRVVANTIETLQIMRDTKRASRKFDLRLLDSKNSRVAANALVYIGTAEISSDVVRRVRRHLESSDAVDVAAGLFAWGEIAQHHNMTDPVYFRTQTDFLKLSSRFEALAGRSSTIARHAADAALKAGETELASRLDHRACA
jgi:class 3 adenylate cyclase